MKDAIRTQRGSVIGPVIATLVVIGLVAVAGFQLHRARERLIDENDSLAADLSASQARVAELRSQLETEQAARVEVEAAAKAAADQAARQHDEARERQEALDGRIRELETSVREHEQRVASAEQARAKVESTLARESELREALDQELAGVREQLRQRDAALADRMPAGAPEGAGLADVRGSTRTPETPSSAPEAAAPASGPASAAKLRLDDEEERAREPFDTPPKPVDLVSPQYPSALKDQGTGGEVTVAFTVDTSGRVQDVEVREASNPEFGEAALEAVRRWRFKPAMRDGEPVEVRIAQKLTFNSR